MQGCRRACLAQLALWAAIAAGFFWFVRDAGPQAIGVSLGIGLLATAALLIRRTTFAKRDTSRDRASALDREWADDDGVFRIDRRHTDGDVDLNGSFLFEERHLKPGDHVCAFGVFSSTRGGIVPDERWGKTARIMRGTAREIAQRLGKRAISYALIAIVLAAASILLARNYLTIVN